jgi:hypothetical protein
MKKVVQLLVLLSLALTMEARLVLAASASGGGYNVRFSKYGTADSTTTGAAALIFSVPNLKVGQVCVVNTKSFGTGPADQKGPTVVTANTITVTYDANQTAGTTTINYLCFKP